MVPRVCVFGGKAASAYYMAKKIVGLILSISETVNNDPEVGDLLKVGPPARPGAQPAGFHAKSAAPCCGSHACGEGPRGMVGRGRAAGLGGIAGRSHTPLFSSPPRPIPCR